MVRYTAGSSHQKIDSLKLSWSVGVSGDFPAWVSVLPVSALRGGGGVPPVSFPRLISRFFRSALSEWNPFKKKLDQLAGDRRHRECVQCQVYLKLTYVFLVFLIYSYSSVCARTVSNVFSLSVTTSLQQRNICYDLEASKQLWDCVT